VVDGDDVAEFSDRVRGALDGASSWFAVQGVLARGLNKDEMERLRPLFWALDYRLLVPETEESRQVHGSAFAPLSEASAEATYPPRLRELTEDTLSIWEHWLAAIDHPVLQSRLNDLLWEVRRGEQPVIHARAAAVGYLALAEGDWEAIHRADCADRALELGQSVSDAQLIAASIERLLHIATTELGARERRPGVTLRALSAVVDLPKKLRPDAAGQLLDQALQRYSPDAWIEESIRDLQATLVPPEQRVAIRRVQVERWREEARAAQGMRKHVHLQHALQLARTHGLSPEANDTIAELQRMTVDDLDLKATSTEIKLPTEETNRFLAHLATLPRLTDALTEFGVYGPPIGEPQATAEFFRDLAQQVPTKRLFPRQVIGPYSSVVWEASTPESHERLEAQEHNALAISVFAHTSARILGLRSSWW
jgi:hypothetical protein